MKLLDTNVIIALLNGSKTARTRFEAAINANIAVAVSSIAIYELWYGVAKSARRQENSEHLDAFLSGPIVVLQFDAEDGAVAGEVRARLERSGQPIGPYDVLLAGQAIRRGAALVTANKREFARVSGLKIEDWTAIRR